MPTKKAAAKKPAAKTTKKSVTKKPAVRKTATKKTAAPKPTAVVAQKQTMSKNDSKCCKPKQCKVTPWIIMILLLINTALLAFIFFKKPVEIKDTITTSFYDALEKFEATKVGGEENYKIIKEIYKLDAYQEDQQRRLNTTLGTLKQMEKDGTVLPQ